jgi:S-adenosylmethionine:tRNA ribosyltransferase-isomerase
MILAAAPARSEVKRKLSARRSPPKHRDAVRLLALDVGRDAFVDARADDLPRFLQPGDLLIVNDAATIPASLSGRTETGGAIEVRLCGHGDGPSRFQAVLFGAGDWRMRTEDRPPPPLLAVGERIVFGELKATVLRVSQVSTRLLEIEFDRSGAALWDALYAIGRPIQYSYLARDLPLDAVQTSFGGRPFAFEMPSAGRPLSFSILAALRARGVRIAAILHAAGVSATGDPALDAALPLPERYEIPPATIEAIAEAHASGHRIIAVGTTVVRAIEGCYRTHGRLVAGAGATDLVIDPAFRPRVIDGLLSGLHDPGESHYRLLSAFAGEALLARAIAHAAEHGYHYHELGDSMLIYRTRGRRSLG